MTAELAIVLSLITNCKWCILLLPCITKYFIFNIDMFSHFRHDTLQNLKLSNLRLLVASQCIKPKLLKCITVIITGTWMFAWLSVIPSDCKILCEKLKIFLTFKTRNVYSLLTSGGRKNFFWWTKVSLILCSSCSLLGILYSPKGSRAPFMMV